MGELMMTQQKAGKQPKVSNRTYLLLIVLLSLAIIALAVIFLRDSTASADLNGLPNYTEIKGKFVAEGLKYEKQPHWAVRTPR
ncbi:hypothetical protein HMSSN036_81420 [Paenibacillus macerans]|nr:hypothetical protein HMSSN036_81420 [Paenibacillus macerans]